MRSGVRPEIRIPCDVGQVARRDRAMPDLDARLNALDHASGHNHRVDVVSVESFLVIGVNRPVAFNSIAKRHGFCSLQLAAPTKGADSVIRSSDTAQRHATLADPTRIGSPANLG